MQRVFKKNRDELSRAAADLKQARRERRANQDADEEVRLPEQASVLTRAVDAALGVFASDPQFLRRLEVEIEARLPNSGKTREG